MRHAVIMAGGGGTRLWPASRRRRPKQLLALGGAETLLAATARRLATVVGMDRIVVVTAADQAAAVAMDLPRLEKAQILAEPCPRNTAAAIGWAATVLAARDPDAVIGAVPADHHIGDEAAYAAAVERAYKLAEHDDAIVTLGIKPTRPDTGFGYLELGGAGPGDARVVARFVEKPDRARAEEYLRAGHLWNGGLFFFRAAKMLGEIDRLLPALGAGLRAIAGGAKLAEVYPTLPSISIDFGVMEKTSERVLTLPGDFGWNDVGSWSALAEVRPADADGNVVAGQALAIDARDNIVFSDVGLVALVGVSGLCVARAGNALLVIPRERAQEVREIVKRLEAAGADDLL